MWFEALTVLTFIIGAPESQTAAQKSDLALVDLTSDESDRLLAVFDVRVAVDGLDPVVGESLSAVLAAEVQLRVGRNTRVVSRNELRALMDQSAAEQLLGCEEARCYRDLGSLFAADMLVTSSLAKLDEEFLFTMQLIDVTFGTVVRRQSVAFYGTADQLVDLIPPYTSLLIEGPPAENYRGSVRVVTSEAESSVTLNNVDLGLSPISQVDELAIGRHRLRIAKSGYLPVEQDVVVQRGQTTLFQAQLIDEASLRPWYAQWWVWGGAAVIVGGAVATAILLSGDDDPTSLEIRTPLP
ncbi:MAG: PEGA domain-containing protein [Myxococcota bacterium]